MVLHPPAAAQMDVLTGRAVREVYFDPARLIGKDGKILASTVEESRIAELLYKPVRVVQELPNENIIVVRDELDQVRGKRSYLHPCNNDDSCPKVLFFFHSSGASAIC